MPKSDDFSKQIWKIQEGDIGNKFILAPACNPSYSLYQNHETNAYQVSYSGIWLAHDRIISIIDGTTGYIISMPGFKTTLNAENNDIEFSNSEATEWDIDDDPYVEINYWLRAYYNKLINVIPEVIDIPNYIIKVSPDKLSLLGSNYSVQTESDGNGMVNVTKNRERTMTDSDGQYTIVERSYTNKLNWAGREALDRKKSDTWIYDYLSEKITFIENNLYDIDNSNLIKTTGVNNEKVFYSTQRNRSRCYWVAVGPNVVYNGQMLENQEPNPNKMYKTGVIDAVLMKENEDVPVYVHCFIGETKAHTWNNGVIQSNLSYATLSGDSVYDISKHKFIPNVDCGTSEYNDASCIEFMGSAAITNPHRYSISHINFYKLANEPIES